MAQTAGFMSQDNRTNMGIPVFWTTLIFRPSVEFQDMARSIFTGCYSEGEFESGTIVRRTKGRFVGTVTQAGDSTRR